MLYFSDSCEHTIRCVASAQHDENKPEDLDTEGEDHACDEVRYACNSRPLVLNMPEKKPEITYPKSVYSMTFNDLVAHQTRNSKKHKELI